ncbi:uncharacterized protein LOC110837310 isoform X2 [Zootermopsis nevadensis]|nr:uncharacterized protein LOC110837310 isoform X2 [Zootermopsis nevadensis]XP_021934965.1 uncharacterized protein LOC110837310 isoform X2 [Zootermopsis nevadensis]
MIERKDEISSPSNSSADLTNPAATLAHCHQLLQLTTCQAQAKLRGSFARLTEALQSREKQLLRQVDVLHSQQIALLQSQHSVPTNCIIGDAVKSIPQVSLNLDQENYLCESILTFGKVNVEGGNLVAIEGNVAPFSVPYRVEDYQDANEDHVCLYKPLSNHSTPQQDVVQFSLAPRLKGFSEGQQEGTLATPECTLVNSQVSSEPVTTAKDSFVGDCRRPSQVQQWLQQIMAETETEPSIGEQENFSSLSQSEHLFD